MTDRTVQSQDGASLERLHDNGDGTFSRVVYVQNPGGGGGGGSLSDTILTDDSGTFFIARDSGTALTYITLSGSPYTPSTNIRPADVPGIAQLHTDNGADGNGITPPTGGAGIRGWLSGIYKAITGNVTIIDAFQAPIVTNWTSATAQNTAVTMVTSGYDLVNVTINPPAGLTGGAISFQVYDGAGWIAVKAARTDSYLTDSTFQLTNSPGFKAWQVPVSGFPQFRIILSSAIVGSGTVVATTIVSSAPDVSIVTAGLDPQSPLPAGTNALGSVITTNGYTPSSAVIGAGTITAATGLGTVTAAATDYIAVLANPTANYLCFQNQHASANIWINPLGPAYASGSYTGQKIPAGGSFVWDARVPVTALHAASDTAGANFFVQVA
ncbi:MAG: hypothetical protein JO253_08120 [Alphaproteobacteria bacterium]|nr:hypothetical protein [Alphaproteobacteria bacterium]